MGNLLTVIYYTSNREDEAFESRIQETLLESIGDLPLISVSQKPIDFGENICVGDIGASAENVLLQVRAGAMAATTPFIVQAEADCLYHKSYFDFKPERDDTIYYTDFFYLLWPEKPAKFYRKKRGDLSGFSGREYLIDVIDKINQKPFEHLSNVAKKLVRQEWFQNEIPVVSFKTRNGMHYGSTIRRNKNERSLPYWGKPKDLIDKYIKGVL